MVRRAFLRFHTRALLSPVGWTLMATLLTSAVAVAQSDAGGQTFPPGFDCNTLDAANTRLECQILEARRAPNNGGIPPGTPAIPMPGQSNSTSGPYIGGSDAGPQDFAHSRRTNH